jgi:hypothetical protein
MNDKRLFFINASFLGLFSAIIFYVCFYVFLITVFSHMSFMGSPDYDSTPKEHFLTKLSMVGMLISLLICPLFALIRIQQINRIAEKKGVLFATIFIATCFLQIAFLIILFSISYLLDVEFKNYHSFIH